MSSLFPRFASLRQSIAFRYLGIACGVLVSTQVALGLIQARSQFHGGLKALEQKADKQTQFLSAVVPEALLDMDFLAMEILMRQSGRDRDFVYSVILDRQGTPLTRYLDREHPSIARALETQGIDLEATSLQGEEMLNLLEAIEENANLAIVEKPIVSGETFLGKAVLGYSLENVRRQLYWQAGLILLEAIAASGLLAILTAVLFNRQVRRPLHRLASAAQQFAEGDLEHRARVGEGDRNDEVGRLTKSFNKMADRLQNTLEGLQERNRTLAFTNAELARATRLKDEFLSNMSHELRTPLNAVLGLSQALKEKVYGPLTERQELSLDRILTSGQHLLSLINDILDLAKIESGKEELQIVPLPVSILCQTCLDLVRRMAEEKHLELTLEVEVIPNVFAVDERRIRQVLLNLLNNAIKFTPEGGSIAVTARGDRDEQVLRIAVRDTGIGIAREDMSKLFESFVQIESSLSRRYEGTGLGLALVRRLVELHGGSIAVESEVGKGSCFTVVLPWRNPEQLAPADKDRLAGAIGTIPESILATPPDIKIPAPPDGEYLILIAEDNENNVMMLADYLTFKGYKLAFAKNGLEAVSLAKETKPQLILMDIHMPRMDGLEATRWIRSDRETSDVPIIALTALAMPGDREKCKEAGLDDYITKPVNLERLLQRIHVVLNPENSEVESSAPSL
ncbi:MAG: response regulator [Cyanobacteria bacterium SBLK]|nr:response regulator [Cyanobacteria bacterium SBLK]